VQHDVNVKGFTRTVLDKLVGKRVLKTVPCMSNDNFKEDGDKG